MAGQAKAFLHLVRIFHQLLSSTPLDMTRKGPHPWSRRKPGASKGQVSLAFSDLVRKGGLAGPDPGDYRLVPTGPFPLSFLVRHPACDPR
jgi:hypothetical protein